MIIIIVVVVVVVVLVVLVLVVGVVIVVVAIVLSYQISHAICQDVVVIVGVDYSTSNAFIQSKKLHGAISCVH